MVEPHPTNVTAAFSGHSAGEVEALGAGYFSHVLASGLAGAADADGDRLVSFGELAAFVAYNTDRLGASRDLRQVADDEHLIESRKLFQLARDDRCCATAQSGIDFIEDQRRYPRPLEMEPAS